MNFKTMSALDYFAAATAGINGVSYKMRSDDGLITTVANSDFERDSLIAAGYKVIETFKTF